MAASSEDPDDIHDWLQALKRQVPFRGGSSVGPNNNGAGATTTTTASSTGGTTTTTTSADDESFMGGVGSSSSSSRLVFATLANYGKVQGIRTQGFDFFGNIPYAAPPVGNHRFAPPEPPTPWSPAVLDGTHYGCDCWQVVVPSAPTEEHNKDDSLVNQQMSEDCLKLNVFLPAGQATRKKSLLLPVLVWFHGGAFQQGGAHRPEYNGKSLVERELIVVTINYRLGALGFLVSSSDGLYGNYGLMDQRAALDWVRDNIQDFGGDPNRVTLFGESAGAIMIGLHLLMRPTPFHRVILQSNAMGYTFRSPTIADFIGEAFKRSVDCRDLGCLRSERVEDLIRAQSTLMGVPRSVGDFFTWGPTLTQQRQITIGPPDHTTAKGGTAAASPPLRLERYHMFRSHPVQSPWAMVNVSQPLSNLDRIPDDIPIIIGTNKHEGEMFVYTAFPAPMPKPVYWMFVGALFRDSGSRVLRHYRGLVEQVEQEAEALVKIQLEEEENKQFYLEHQEQLENEYELLLAMNETRKAQRRRLKNEEDIQALVDQWARGGAIFNTSLWERFRQQRTPEEEAEIAQVRAQRRLARQKARALREAAKVVVDYRPVMSRIIDDYLFRCPSWHFANRVSQNRAHREKEPNVYVYRFSQPTHVPGYKYCWGKSCHTAELPYVFHAMDVIRANYSTVGPMGQQDAPAAPEYPYTDMLTAFRGALEAYESDGWATSGGANEGGGGSNPFNHTSAFQRIVDHFFGNYFKVDADEEIASDMVNRWAAFAKTGSPNYEDSQVQWMPWRNRHQLGTDDKEDEGEAETVTGFRNNDKFRMREEVSWLFSAGENDEDLTDVEDEGDVADDASGNKKEHLEHQIWSDQREERAYRRRALGALGFEVVEEDRLRTELKRVGNDRVTDQLDRAYLTSRFLLSHQANTGGFSPELKEQVMRISQELGVMGMGLSGDDKYAKGWTIQHLLPELFELKWPPEGRLVERDCTCDLWDKIRCKSRCLHALCYTIACTHKIELLQIDTNADQKSNAKGAILQRVSLLLAIPSE